MHKLAALAGLIALAIAVSAAAGTTQRTEITVMDDDGSFARLTIVHADGTHRATWERNAAHYVTQDPHVIEAVSKVLEQRSHDGSEEQHQWLKDVSDIFERALKAGTAARE